MKSYLTLVLFLILFTSTLVSQTLKPKLEWVKIYNGPGNGVDITQSISMDKENNIYLAGRSSGPDSSQDLLVLKFSTEGDSLLELRYSPIINNWEEALALVVDTNLDFYVLGSIIPGVTTPPDLSGSFLQKYSSSGEFIWSWKLISYAAEGSNIILNSFGELIAGYGSDSANISKFSSSGDSLWTLSIHDDTSWYKVNYLVADVNDNIYAAVTQFYEDGGDLPATKVLLIKIDNTGTLLWSKAVDSFYGKKILVDSESDVILLSADSRITKFTADGDTLWHVNYPRRGDIVITSDFQIDSHNNIIFTGYGGGEDSWDYFTYKLSPGGGELWRKIFNSDEKLDDFSRAIAIDKNDNIYITGSTRNLISFGVCYTVKYSPEGDQLWKYKLDIPGSRFGSAKSIFTDDSNNIFIGGDIVGSNKGYDFVAFKISQELSTGVAGTNNVKAYSLSQNYPNPFNPTTNIKFQIADFGLVTITLYDVLGHKVRTLLKEEKEPGSYEINYDASELASGVYLFKLSAGSFNQTRKMIIQK